MLVLLLACKPSPSTEPTPDVPIEDELTEVGPYGVGYREVTIEYDAAGARSLRTATWYPTDAAPGAAFKYFGLFDAPGVVPDADPAQGDFPVIVYSHGHQGFAEASGRIVADLVRHGHIVVATDHTDNTFLDGSDRTTAIFWQRATDLGALLDHTLDDAHFLADVISDAPIVGVGHSFGGYTMNSVAGATYAMDELLVACGADPSSPFCSTMDASSEARFRAGLRDDRIAAVVSMAPGNIDLWGQTGLQDIDIPVLLMSGGLDDPPLADAHWAGLNRAGNLHVELTDAGHNAFTDFAAGLDDAPGSIEPEVAWRVIGAYVWAFVRSVHGDEAVAPVLDGTKVIGDTTVIELP